MDIGVDERVETESPSSGFRYVFIRTNFCRYSSSMISTVPTSRNVSTAQIGIPASIGARLKCTDLSANFIGASPLRFMISAGKHIIRRDVFSQETWRFHFMPTYVLKVLPKPSCIPAHQTTTMAPIEIISPPRWVHIPPT
jgi:hypothetical protein